MVDPKKDPNRRSSARIVESFRFRLGVDGFELEGEILNISTTGLLCALDRPLPLMTRVLMALVLPQRKDLGVVPDPKGAIKVVGAVVRCESVKDHYETALYFQEIDNRGKRCLERYLYEPS